MHVGKAAEEVTELQYGLTKLHFSKLLIFVVVVGNRWKMN